MQIKLAQNDNKIFIMSINARFTELLKAKNISQSEAGKLLKVSRQTIGAIVSGRSNLTLDHFMVLIKKYPDINYKWLLFNDGDMHIHPDLPGAYIQERQADYITICQECIRKDKEIEVLKDRIKDKDELLKFFRSKKESNNARGA